MRRGLLLQGRMDKEGPVVLAAVGISSWPPWFRCTREIVEGLLWLWMVVAAAGAPGTGGRGCGCAVVVVVLLLLSCLLGSSGTNACYNLVEQHMRSEFVSDEGSPAMLDVE